MIPPQTRPKTVQSGAWNIKRQVVLTTDLSEVSTEAFCYAFEQVAPSGTLEGHLTLLHISEDLTRATFGIGLGENRDAIRNDIEHQSMDELNELRDILFTKGLVDTVVVRAEESVYSEILPTRGVTTRISLLQRAMDDRFQLGLP